MKKILIGAAAGICILAVGFTIFHKSDQSDATETDAPSGSVASSENTASEVLPESTSQTETPFGFTEIDFGDSETMVGQSDYFSLSWFREMAADEKERLQLVKANTVSGPMKFATGNQVYYSAVDDEKFIISGFQTMKLWQGQINDTSFMREEDTGTRIYVFPNSSEEQTFQDQWGSGQRILSGTTNGEKGDIILDGKLIDAKWTEENGEITFSLYDVMRAFDRSTYYAEEKGYIDISPNEFTFIRVPTNAASYKLYDNLHISGDKFTFKSWSGNAFTAKLPVLDFSTTQITAHNASIMLGWRMYTNSDGVLSIVSDSLNVSNLSCVYTNGSMGIQSVVETDENGNEVINTYDSNGKLLSSESFDSSDLGEGEDATNLTDEEIAALYDEYLETGAIPDDGTGAG